jgi:hypothetical protein
MFALLTDNRQKDCGEETGNPANTSITASPKRKLIPGGLNARKMGRNN